MHKLRVGDDAREYLRDLMDPAVNRRRTNRGRGFNRNLHDSGSRALDLNDQSQRIAQEGHIGKTIDDIDENDG